MHRFRVRAAQVVAAGLIALTLGAEAHAQTALKWKGKVGDKFKYTFNQSTEVKFSIQGQPGSNKSDLTLDLNWAVKSVDKDGTIEFTFAAERAKMRIVSAGRILEYDSNDKDASLTPELAAFRKIYDAMLNQPFTVKMNPQGEILDAKVPDVVVAAAGNTPFAANADSGSFLSAKGVKTTFAQILPNLPKTPVSAGSTWKGELAVPPSGPLSMKLDYLFKATNVTPSLATIDGTITTSVETKSDAEVRTKLNKQAGSSQFKFDPDAGRLTESTLHQSLDMTFTVNGTETPQSIAINSSFKMVK